MTIKINHNSVIAFDLDDTLYKEVNFVRSAFTEIAKEIQPENWENLYLNMFQKFKEQRDVFGFLEETHGRYKNDLLSKYRQHKPSVGITKIPQELVISIQAAGGKAGVITDGRVITQTNKIKALGLNDLLDFIIISEATGHDKKDVHNFNVLQEKFPGHAFTYIADNPRKDFYHPNDLGWQTIGILDNGSHIHPQYIPLQSENYMPKFWVTDLSVFKISS
ncbi:HAD family hydrolase [Robertkochia sediminum]|uniref:HAD family hydrolase n=1 Tax=Robertkochia sediminum TaxID=2785326 RepID=UPI0019328821|nr:HAD family hydrolase [Robertkochia sediminum]MBL7474051.1 HAD family hydrolase [Robertkochia sediminum]